MQTFYVNFYDFSSLFYLIIIYVFLLGYENNANYIYIVYDCSILLICIEIAGLTINNNMTFLLSSILFGVLLINTCVYSENQKLTFSIFLVSTDII